MNLSTNWQKNTVYTGSINDTERQVMKISGKLPRAIKGIHYLMLDSQRKISISYNRMTNTLTVRRDGKTEQEFEYTEPITAREFWKKVKQINELLIK